MDYHQELASTFQFFINNGCLFQNQSYDIEKPKIYLHDNNSGHLSESVTACN